MFMANVIRSAHETHVSQMCLRIIMTLRAIQNRGFHE